MSIALKLDIPEGAFSAIRKSPSEFVHEMRLAAAVKWYELGIVSQSKAAEIAGLSRSAFLSELSRYQVTPFQYDADEVTREVTS